jgi:hypothetical protein
MVFTEQNADIDATLVVHAHGLMDEINVRQRELIAILKLIRLRELMDKYNDASGDADDTSGDPDESEQPRHTFDYCAIDCIATIIVTFIVVAIFISLGVAAK